MALFKLTQQTRLVILINFEGLQVYGLDNERLMRLALFEETEQGLDDFRQFLAEQPVIPVSLVVDSLAEDFIVEKVPHVSPVDRKVFLDRKLDQHFRGIKYRSAQILGRESSGRREDRILFSAFTKQQFLDPWVKVLLQEEIPIKSITSPAFAICKVAQELGLDTDEPILLVNWQRSGIRQSYIANDKLMFSRLTPLPSDPDADLAQVIINACTQSKDYIERIGLITFNQSVDVHVVTPVLDDAAFSELGKVRGFRKVFHHNSVDLMPINRYGGPQNNITAILLCLDWGLRDGDFEDVYGTPDALRFMYLHKARTGITLATIAILLFGTLFSLPLLLQGIEQRENYQTLLTEISPLQDEYDRLTAQFPETPIPSEAMAVAVNNYNLIVGQANMPMDIFTPVSQVLARFPTVSLEVLDWQHIPNEVDINFSEALLSNQTVVTLELNGVLVGGRGFQNADRIVRQLSTELNQIEGVTARPVSLPIPSRPDAEVNAVINDEVRNAEFTIRLRYEA